MFVGSAFDKTLDFNYRSKKREGKDLPVSVLTDYAEAYINEQSGEIIFDDEGSKGEQIDTAKSSCHKGIILFNREVFPSVEPSHVQAHLSDDSLEIPFHGYIDTIDTSNVVIDNKTAWKRWGNIESRWQNTSYAYLANKNGINSKSTRYDIALLKKRGDPEVIQIEEPVTAAHLGFVEKKINWAISFIKAGISNPEIFAYNTNSFLCKKTMCEFYTTCMGELGVKP